MAIKYLYIDHQPDATKEFADLLSLKPQKLIVKSPTKPKNWDIQIQYLSEHRSEFQGLLIDLKLTNRKKNQEVVKYQAPTLAQELRSLAKENLIKDLPIILCSTENNFEKLYDNTNQDLFDAVFEKDKMNGDAVNEEFIAYVKAYEAIPNNPNLNELLKSNDINISQIEQYFNDLKTVHDKAALLKQVVHPPGILIDEHLLAIRLGIDKDKSKGWEELLKKMNRLKYKGVYSNVWQRWWMPLIFKWWDKNFPSLFFQNTPASEKVEVLTKKFKLKNLTSLELPKFHEYDSFWTKCIKSDLPMVSIDGLRTKDNPKYAKYDWQDIRYISNNFIRNATLKQQKELRNTIYHFHKNSLEEIFKQKNK